MNKKDFENFVDGRYKDQIKWYDDKSKLNKHLNYLFKIPVIIVSAVIPIFAVLEQKWITVVFSATVAILVGISNFSKFEENWQNYRTTCETLKKELSFYRAKINDYKDSASPEELFVQRVESIISVENTKMDHLRERQEERNKMNGD